MLLDRQGNLADVDLLDHAWGESEGRMEVMAARGAGVEAIIKGVGVD